MYKFILTSIFVFLGAWTFSQDTEEKIDSVIAYSNELMSTDANEAFKIANNALSNSKSIGYKKGEADSYCILSEFYRINRKGNECVTYLYQALDIYEKMGYKKGIADVYNDIGLSYDEFGLEGDVVEYYQKSLSINKEIDNKEDMIVNYMNISTYYESKGEYEKSIIYLDTSIYLANAINDSSLIAHSKHFKAYINSSMGNFDESINLYSEALDIYQNQGIEYPQIPLIVNLVSDYIKVGGKFKESIELLKHAEKISLKWGDDYYTSIVYKFINSIYANSGDYEKAYEYHQLYKSYSDSLNNTESEKKLVELKMQHDFDLEKEQIELEQNKKDIAAAEELKRSEITRNAFILGFILILILAIVSFRAFKNKKRASEEIAEKNKEITDSINYAQRLQSAILSPSNKTDDELEDLFVLFQPKDIVSGDFYWVEQVGESVYFSAIDCTGHGVPGAMLSIVGNNALESIIHNQGICQPSAILDRLNKIVYKKLAVQGSRDMGDGMDAAFCRFNKDSNILEFAGANNPVYIVRDREVIVHKGTKTAIGQSPDTVFAHNEIFLQKGDCVYVFSDGYSDQFGGEKGKKMGSKEFKRFLARINPYPMDTQREFLQNNIKDWMGKEEQIDDICVIGFRV